MSQRFLAVAFLAACGSLFAQGTNVNLSGIVTDTAGVPVSGATVALEKFGLTATSGAGGGFVLAGQVASVHGARSSGATVSRLRGGRLHVSLAQGGTVVVTVHGPDGRTLATLSRRLEAGAHRIEMPGNGSGVRFYRVKIAGHEEILRAIDMPGVAWGALSNPSSLMDGAGLPAKAAAGVPLYDAISVSRTGYLKSYVSIVTPDSAGIQIKLLPQNFPRFSFFVTSLKAMLDLSGSPNGFGGDLRFGETGPGAGLRGADKLCATIAERSLRNSRFKGWRAFLSAGADSYGQRADAIDRIGTGPWYDRVGRLLAPTKADLVSPSGRPANGDVTIRNDLPNEDGIPNHRPDPNLPELDNHRTLTGSDTQGRLYMPGASAPSSNFNCSSWTSRDSVATARPRIGWSWSETGNVQWISGFNEYGCGPGINLVQTPQTGPQPPVVGSGGGYGGIYCFARNP